MHDIFKDLNSIPKIFKDNYDEELVAGIQRKAYKIAKFMGTENAKKLSQEQLTNMIMVTR